MNEQIDRIRSANQTSTPDDMRKIDWSLFLKVFLLFFVSPLLSGCTRHHASDCLTNHYFSTGFTLQPGDIILARGGGFLPAAAASLGAPLSPFSHAAVYYEDKKGCGRIVHMHPAGIMVFTPQQYWDKYFLTGLVRRAGKLPVDPERFSKECRKLLEYNRRAPILADFWGESVNGQDYRVGDGYPKSLYCLTLINLLYEKSGTLPPFTGVYDISNEPILKLTGIMDNKTQFEAYIIDSVLTNPDFSLLAQHASNPTEQVRIRIDDEMVQEVNHYLAVGCGIKKPSLPARALLTCLYGFKIAVTPVLPAGIGSMLRKISSFRDLSVFYTMNSFVQTTRAQTLQQLQQNPAESIENATRITARKLKWRYFTAPSLPARK